MAEEGARVPMSPGLQATLLRAREYAASQTHAFVTLEHLLLALTEDADAAQVLEACTVDLARLRHDVAGHLGSQTERAAPGTPGAPAISPALTQVLKYATLAAQQGRRTSIDGAIVLAALVGDGRSMAASFLKAQGLTFDAAIRALREAAAGPVAAPPQQAASPKFDEMPPIDRQPVAMAGDPSALDPQDAHAGTTAQAEQILARARERIENRSLRTEPGVRPSGIANRPSAEAAPVAGQQPTGNWPPPDASPLPSIRQPLPDHRPEEPIASNVPEPAASGPRHGEPPRPHVNGDASPVMSHSDMAPRSGIASQKTPPSQAHQSPLSSPGAHPPHEPSAHPPQRPSAPAPRTQGAPPPLSLGRPQSPPLPPRMPAPAQQPTVERTQEPTRPPWPEPTALPFGAPSPPPQSNPPASWRPRNEAPMPPPSFGNVPPSAYPPASGAPYAPDTDRYPQRPPQAAVDNSQISHSIPARLRQGRPQVVEIRIERPPLTDTGSSARPHAMRAEIVAARAISVRLRSGSGRFSIEALSPETQWDQNGAPGSARLASEAAVWRFSVTPLQAGTRTLNLSVAARTLGADGVLAETQLPDQAYEVRVSTEYVRKLTRVAQFIAAALAGASVLKVLETLLRVDLLWFLR